MIVRQHFYALFKKFNSNFSEDYFRVEAKASKTIFSVQKIFEVIFANSMSSLKIISDMFRINHLN